MPLPIHWYSTQTQPISNLSIYKTNSHQTNMHLNTFNAVINPVTGAAMEYRDLIKNVKTKKVWIQSMANEVGRLAKGFGTKIKQELKKLY